MNRRILLPGAMLVGMIIVLFIPTGLTGAGSIPPPNETLSKGGKDTVDKKIVFGSAEIHDSIRQFNWDDFTEIDETTYRKYASQYYSQLKKDSFRITVADTTFSFKTAKSTLTYNRQFDGPGYVRRRGYCWAQYEGYYSSLGLYALTTYCNGEFTLGDLILVDSLTNFSYVIFSPLDHSFNPPLVSPHQQYFALHVNSISSAEGESYIDIIKISEQGNGRSYREFAFGSLEGFHIEELVWIDDRSFAVKLNHPTFNEQSRTWDPQYSYSKSSVPGVDR